MPQPALEVLIVFFLTLLNGFFSMSEIALVTVRKTRVSSLVKQGNRRAKIVQALQQNPERLFATLQIGISIITIAASAFAGASLAQDLAAALSLTGWELVADNAYAISFAAVVLAVTYLSITIGELIPKSLGLRYAEPMALFAAYPIWWLSRASGWLIKILNFTSNLFLKIFKDKTNFIESRLSEEEIRSLISEGRKAGTISTQEHHIIENVFDFSDLSVEKVMVPRASMTGYEINRPSAEAINQAIESGYSRIPMYQGNINNIVGILYTKKLLSKFNHSSQNLDLREFLVPPYFVPNTMKISEVLQRLQKRKAHMAMVTNEHGEIEGLVTMEDVLEEIVGDITDETDEESKGIWPEGEGFLVSGDVSILDFNKFFGSELPENESFTTVSGFILERLGRFPKAGDSFLYESMAFTVKEATLRTAKTVLVIKQK